MPEYGELHLFSCPVCCERRWVKYHPQRKYHDEECAKRAQKRLAAGEPIADKVWYHRNAWGEEFEVRKSLAETRNDVPAWMEAYRSGIKDALAEERALEAGDVVEDPGPLVPKEK